MFEKEAEKWTIDYVCKDCSRYKECKSKEHCTCKDCSKEKWQNGAEFGYNKANEWHNVKDGNPNNENDILCQISKDEVVVGYYHTVAKRYITIDGQDLYNVIAWKEIVLPKEIKENE